MEGIAKILLSSRRMSLLTLREPVYEMKMATRSDSHFLSNES
jgi:hypothetical protein